MSVTDMIVAAQFALFLTRIGCLVVYIVGDDESFGLMGSVLTVMILLLTLSFFWIGE